MPTQWTLDLVTTGAVPDEHRYDALHFTACAFFEQPTDDHDADTKPFAVRLMSNGQLAHEMTLTWLRDEPPAAAVIPTTLQLSSVRAEVVGLRVSKVALDSLGGESASRIEYRVVTPARFRHHGHDYLLPDPHLTFRNLARRLQAVRPAPIPDEVVRELAGNVEVLRHNIRTQPFVWHHRRKAGFTGTVTFGVPSTCSDAARRLFAQLNHFAALGGIGHGTTHGLGVVDVRAVPGSP
jgi:CRISPR/Cas system endoribonuclease Cas6 (RAMP superfamily)